MLFLVFGFTSTAAGYMSHGADYNMDGSIEMRKQAGHEYKTGARMRQDISGQSDINKQSNILWKKVICK